MKKRDLLWKGIIRNLFHEFVKFFFPDHWQEIDLSRGFTFLDKELEPILPQTAAPGRIADLLVKAFLKTGEEIWFLIHIELQGYLDVAFDERMFVTMYRLYDRFQKQVAALAIFTEADKDFHPKEFGWKRLTTTLKYEFGTYKLMDNPPEKLAERKENPFSFIMETAWHGMKADKMKDEKILEMKVMLFKKLLAGGYDIL